MSSPPLPPWPRMSGSKTVKPLRSKNVAWLNIPSRVSPTPCKRITTEPLESLGVNCHPASTTPSLARNMAMLPRRTGIAGEFIGGIRGRKKSRRRAQGVIRHPEHPQDNPDQDSHDDASGTPHALVDDRRWRIGQSVSLPHPVEPGNA